MWICVCVCVCVEGHACVGGCVCLIMMYGLRSNSLSMNFLSDKYASSYTDWLSCKPVLTPCHSTYKHADIHTYMCTCTHAHKHTNNFPENNDSRAWGRIIRMPEAVHWYHSMRPDCRIYPINTSQRLGDTAISAENTLHSQERWHAESSIKIQLHILIMEKLNNRAPGMYCFLKAHL